METRNPNKLTGHPLNLKVMGEEPSIDDVFLADIADRGVQSPIQILPARCKTTDGRLLPEGTVVCGHRRRLHAIAAGLKSVPVVVRDDLTDPLEIEMVLLKDNDLNLMRKWTTEQKVRNALEIEERERLRRLQAQENGEEFDGQVRPEEVAAQAVGMSRGSYRAGKVAVTAIDSMDNKGHTRNSANVRETLNKSASAAAREVSPPKPEKQAKGNKQVTPKSSIVSIEQAMRGVSKLVQKAEKVTGGRGTYSRSLISTITKLNGTLKEWKDDVG